MIVNIFSYVDPFNELSNSISPGDIPTPKASTDCTIKINIINIIVFFIFIPQIV